MPTIKLFGNCAVVIHSREHNPPHFHIIFRDGRECVVALPDLALTTLNRVSLKEVSQAITWATDHKDLLLKKWKEITKK